MWHFQWKGSHAPELLGFGGHLSCELSKEGPSLLSHHVPQTAAPQGSGCPVQIPYIIDLSHMPEPQR